nr:SDR family oxidoreductase [Actinomycetes bacterium]
PRRVLITDADEFLGPAAVRRFRASGDVVTAHSEPLTSRDRAAELVREHGPFDVVIANLEAPITVARITEHDDATVADLFNRLVDPLFWLFATCLPSMIDARAGAVVVPTSATAIRSSAHPIAGYEAARATQAALVRSVGREMAGHGVRVNGIAPNFIENPSYFPPETVADPAFQESLRAAVPAQRLGRGHEAAAVLWWLASSEASFVFGSIIPTDGGWTLG